MLDFIQYKDSQGIQHQKWGVFLKRDLRGKGNVFRAFSFTEEQWVGIAHDILNYFHQKDTTPPELGE